MSRLEAALRRATTGTVDEPQAEPAASGLEDYVGMESSEALRGSDDGDGFDLIRSDISHEQGQRVVETPPEAAPDAPHFEGFSAKHEEKLVTSAGVPDSLREQYRRLGATLHHAQLESGLKTLMVSSAAPEDGKTLTATNVALTLSESYQRRVLLIDADLRRPSLDEIFQTPKVFGLSEALTSQPERKVSVIQITPHLSLLPAGAPDPDPVSKLTSDRMARLLAEAAAAFEWVVIDTPPVGILTDAKLLGSMVDATLLVVRAGRTPADLAQRAVDAVGRNRILGVVLNRAERLQGNEGYYYYGSYYSSTALKKR